MKRVVGADVETAGQVIHRHRTDSRDKEPLYGLVRAVLDHVIKLADVPFAMRLLPVFAESIGMSKNLVREMVILVDEQVEFQARRLTFRTHTV